MDTCAFWISVPVVPLISRRCVTEPLRSCEHNEHPKSNQRNDNDEQCHCHDKRLAARHDPPNAHPEKSHDRSQSKDTEDEIDPLDGSIGSPHDSHPRIRVPWAT